MPTYLESHFEVIHLAPLFFALAVLIFTAIGWFFGHYRLKKNKEGGITVRDPLVAAIFGLSALVLGFTFSGAASRNSVQMDLMRTQAQLLYKVNGSLKYLSSNDQVAVKNLLDELLTVRLATFKESKGVSDLDAQGKKVLGIARKIQERVIEASANAAPKDKIYIADILLPQVKDLSANLSTWAVNIKSHPTNLLMRFLFGLLCLTAFLIGYTMSVKSENDWLLASIYTAIIGVALYVIISLEFPNILMPYEEVHRDLLVLKESLK